MVEVFEGFLCGGIIFFLIGYHVSHSFHMQLCKYQFSEEAMEIYQSLPGYLRNEFWAIAARTRVRFMSEVIKLKETGRK